MNLLDILLAIPLGVAIFIGWRNGLIREVSNLIGVLLGIWAATHLSQLVATLLGLEGESSVLIAFMVCFVGALVLAYLLGRFVERMFKVAHINIFNHIAGAVAGMLTAVCTLSVIIGFIVTLDSNEKVITPSAKESSMLYKPVHSTGSRLTASIKQYIHDHKDEWKEALEQ